MNRKAGMNEGTERQKKIENSRSKRILRLDNVRLDGRVLLQRSRIGRHGLEHCCLYVWIDGRNGGRFPDWEVLSRMWVYLQQKNYGIPNLDRKLFAIRMFSRSIIQTHSSLWQPHYETFSSHRTSQAILKWGTYFSGSSILVAHSIGSGGRWKSMESDVSRNEDSRHRCEIRRRAPSGVRVRRLFVCHL